MALDRDLNLVRHLNKNTPPRRDDDEELDLQLDAPAFVPLNQQTGVFDRDVQNRFGGINARASVFDRRAVFHTREGTDL